MKCEKCNSNLELTFDNMMIFEFSTIFECKECGNYILEGEIESDIEKLYWEGTNK